MSFGLTVTDSEHGGFNVRADTFQKRGYYLQLDNFSCHELQPADVLTLPSTSRPSQQKVIFRCICMKMVHYVASLTSVHRCVTLFSLTKHRV